MIAGMQTHLSDLLSRLLSLPHETEWVEFKRNYHNPEDIGQYLSAISNSVALHGQKAGYIVWGIEDQSHSPVGTSFRPRAAKFGNEDLEPWLARNLHPDLNFIIHEFLYKARSIVLFEIPPANYTPVTWKGIAYIRVGSCRKKLRDHSEKERALWNRLSGTIFETGIAASRLTADDVLNVLDYSSFFEMSDQRMPTRKVAILERLTKEKLVTHVCRGHWDLTNLGALLFARKLSDLGTLGRKAVRVIVYRSNDRTATIKEHVSIRGYAAGFEELMNYINDQIPQSEQISGALRREVPLYPSIAVRELLANALIHQDLWLRGVSSTIEIFSDRIEITNPVRPSSIPCVFSMSLPSLEMRH
jgi:predicted HTH transcriptional regulator